MTRALKARLLLDEMYSPVIAEALRKLGHDVVAVAERAELRAMTDAEIFGWAAGQGRWLMTENVKDYRPALLQALQTETAVTGLLCCSNRSFPRSRKNPGPLINALHAWLTAGLPDSPVLEDWLTDDE
jgi:predicted nuclease of predicted toxin-antitoxin system